MQLLLIPRVLTPLIGVDSCAFVCSRCSTPLTEEKLKRSVQLDRRCCLYKLLVLRLPSLSTNSTCIQLLSTNHNTFQLSSQPLTTLLPYPSIPSCNTTSKLSHQQSSRPRNASKKLHDPVESTASCQPSYDQAFRREAGGRWRHRLGRAVLVCNVF